MSKPVVAVFGTNGFLGKPILEALTSPDFSKNFTLPIIAITRDASKYTSDDKVVYKQAAADDELALEKALQGIDVFINAGPVTIDLEKLVKAAIKGGAKLYIPSHFGVETKVVDTYLPVLKVKTDHSKRARELGIKTVDVTTSLFAKPGLFLYENILSVGHDPSTNTVTYVGDENVPLTVSKLEDVGKSVASLASKDPLTLPDSVRIYSDKVSREEIVQRYEKTHNVTLKREHKSAEQGLKELQDIWNSGKFSFADHFFYFLNVVAGQGPGKGLIITENERELVNPGESLFKWGKF